MPYFVRCFCRNAALPPINDVVASLRAEGIILTPNVSDPRQLAGPDWSAVHLQYDPERLPLVVECTRDADARAECDEFAEAVGLPLLSLAKRRVLRHLKNTELVIGCQLLSDINDAGYSANAAFLSYFVDHNDGMIQADDEGFYAGNRLILRLR